VSRLLALLEASFLQAALSSEQLLYFRELLTTPQPVCLRFPPRLQVSRLSALLEASQLQAALSSDQLLYLKHLPTTQQHACLRSQHACRCLAWHVSCKQP
jgi:hypothetical protein